MVTAPAGFRLFRFFAIASVLAVSVATSVVGWVVARAARDDLVDEGRAFATLVVAHIEARLDDAGLRSALEPNGVTPSAEERAALDRAVRSAIAGLGTLKVNIFDLDGLTRYTTGPRPIDPGRVNTGAAFSSARDGETVAKLTNSVQHDEGGTVETVALETYVPSRDAQGRVRAVIEVYQDARHLVSGIRTAALRVAALSLSSMLATVAVLFVVFLRGDRTIRDRTRELRSANKALEELTAKLEAEVADRTSKLVAQERLALLGTVATGLAHEVNNPLAAIATASEALLRRFDRASGGGDATAKEYLEIIRDEAFRAKAITRDLLDFARKEDASGDAPVDLNEVVRGVAALLKLRPRRAGTDVALALAPDDSLPRVPGRAGKLRQAIFNVTDNAIDALGPSGGHVTWTTSVEEGAQGPAVVLRCTDDGAGMSEEVRARAFEPFFTTKEPGQGTGLGLSISWGIVESHGGTIAIEGRGAAGGTTVTIRLPVRPQARRGQPATPDPSLLPEPAGSAS